MNFQSGKISWLCSTSTEFLQPTTRKNRSSTLDCPRRNRHTTRSSPLLSSSSINSDGGSASPAIVESLNKGLSAMTLFGSPLSSNMTIIDQESSLDSFDGKDDEHVVSGGVSAPSPMKLDSGCPTPVLCPQAERIECFVNNDFYLCSQTVSSIQPSGSVPIRCESVFGEDDDESSAEAPCKFPRPHGSIGTSSRSRCSSQESFLCHVAGGFRGKTSSSLGALPAVPESLIPKHLPTPDPIPETVPRREVMKNFFGTVLPVTKGVKEHYYVSPKVARDLMHGRIKLPHGYNLLIWDARFPYEYVGHIKKAVNFTSPDIRQKMEDLVRTARAFGTKYFVLCYCQFSSARAPKLVEILHAVEYDIKLGERSNRCTLASDEESRFVPLIIEGGYNSFYNEFHDECEGGYIREEDNPEQGAKCRTDYHADIAGACLSRALSESDVAPLIAAKKTRSFCANGGTIKIQPRRMDMDCSENDDDSNTDENVPTTQGVSTSFYDDLDLSLSDEDADLF